MACSVYEISPLDSYNISIVAKHPKIEKIEIKGKVLANETYSKEFKSEAVRLSDEIGVKKAAAQLGLPYYTLADWRQQRKEHKRKCAPLNGQEARELIERLKRETRELREANEILKDALGFFAKGRKK